MWGELLGFAADAALESGRIKMLKEAYASRVLAMIDEDGSVTISGVGRRFAITQRDARIVLYSICRQGSIYEATNGKFYRVSAGLALNHSYLANIRPVAFIEEQSLTYERELEDRRKRRTGIIVLSVMVAATGGMILLLANRSQPAPVTMYEPPHTTTGSWQPASSLDRALDSPPSVPLEKAIAAPPPIPLTARSTHTLKGHHERKRHPSR